MHWVQNLIVMRGNATGANGTATVCSGTSSIPMEEVDSVMTDLKNEVLQNLLQGSKRLDIKIACIW